MTLQQLQDLKQWHRHHSGGRAMEAALCDLVLCVWAAGWTLLLALAVIDAPAMMPVSLLIAVAASWTALFIAFRLRSTHRRLRDRIALLRDGQIFACGAPAEVLTAETVSDVYRTPVEVIERRGEFGHRVAGVDHRSEARAIHRVDQPDPRDPRAPDRLRVDVSRLRPAGRAPGLLRRVRVPLRVQRDHPRPRPGQVVPGHGIAPGLSQRLHR